jgi:hypothetical protein
LARPTTPVKVLLLLFRNYEQGRRLQKLHNIASKKEKENRKKNLLFERRLRKYVDFTVSEVRHGGVQTTHATACISRTASRSKKFKMQKYSPWTGNTGKCDFVLKNLAEVPQKPMCIMEKTLNKISHVMNILDDLKVHGGIILNSLLHSEGQS